MILQLITYNLTEVEMYILLFITTILNYTMSHVPRMLYKQELVYI